jgi:hypothetical protein
MSVEVLFKFLAYSVPAIMVLGGILLLVLGYPINNDGMIKSGWGLILFRGDIYVLELFLYYYSD